KLQAAFSRIEHIKKPNRNSSDWAGITLDILGVYLTGPGSYSGNVFLYTLYSVIHFFSRRKEKDLYHARRNLRQGTDPLYS
ncbi:MAG: hypothetical protein IKD66_06570, partial [Solobacterium sp.]|nr:hypothetical protein [Solobacterium sp.]